MDLYVSIHIYEKCISNILIKAIHTICILHSVHSHLSNKEYLDNNLACIGQFANDLTRIGPFMNDLTCIGIIKKDLIIQRYIYIDNTYPLLVCDPLESDLRSQICCSFLSLTMRTHSRVYFKGNHGL